MYRLPTLRPLLRANALFASTTGLIALAATGSISRLLGVGEHRLVSATGAGLLVFACVLVVVSGTTTRRLIGAGRLISAADGLWVAGTVVVIWSAELTARGNLLLGAIAAMVACFAVLQLLASNLEDVDAHEQGVEVSRVLDGAVEDVWAAVIDHESYGRLAPNLSRVMPTGPDGPELTRRCWDTRGRQWDESCVLWEEGRRFAVVVDTGADDYPYPLDHLRGEWSVRPVAADQTEVTVRFELRPTSGAAGSAFAAAMTAGAKPLIRRILSGWQQIVLADGGTRLSRRRSPLDG